uniref:Putative secreted protein n=1 Tax=Anopheles darlingi TaxID=43151 RepID=A0A2M4D2A6_ANODA
MSGKCACLWLLFGLLTRSYCLLLSVLEGLCGPFSPWFLPRTFSSSAVAAVQTQAGYESWLASVLCVLIFHDRDAIHSSAEAYNPVPHRLLF